MEALKVEVEPDSSQTIVGQNWNDFLGLSQPQKNLAILERPRLRIDTAVRELLESDFESFQVSVTRDEDPMIVGCYLEDDLALRSSEAGTLYLDVVQNLTEFFRLSDAQEIGVQLEAIRSDMCALFHYDLLSLRLVCTYQGPGTEWLLNEHVNRSGLLKGNNDLVLKAGALVRSLPLHYVGLMKGEKYHSEAGRSLIHRSPTINGTGIERLFLRMDVLK